MGESKKGEDDFADLRRNFVGKIEGEREAATMARNSGDAAFFYIIYLIYDAITTYFGLTDFLYKNRERAGIDGSVQAMVLISLLVTWTVMSSRLRKGKGYISSVVILVFSIGMFCNLIWDFIEYLIPAMHENYLAQRLLSVVLVIVNLSAISYFIGGVRSTWFLKRNKSFSEGKYPVPYERNITADEVNTDVPKSKTSVLRSMIGCWSVVLVVASIIAVVYLIVKTIHG